MPQLTKSQAFRKVKEHFKNKKNAHAVTGLPVEITQADTPTLAMHSDKPSNPAEETALLQFGMKLGVFALEDLDDECRNSIEEL
jgi:D-alanyl-D-alanine carboxypeptidase